MGRPRKTYFGEEPEDDEHRGLLSAGSQDPIPEASSVPASPKGKYQGLGRTLTPHSVSAPANLSTTAWDGDVDDIISAPATESPDLDDAPVT